MKARIQDPNVFLTLTDLMRLEWLNAIAPSSKTGRSKNTMSGHYASKVRGRGLDFEESRPYVIGDDIRNINWNVTAKTGRTFTKVFNEEKEKPVFIFVDQSPSMGFGSVNKTKAVVAGELAAIIAHKYKKKGDRIGGMVYAGLNYSIIPPKRDPKNILYFFQEIVDGNQIIYNHDSFDFETTISEVFQRINNVIAHDYLVYIISDFSRYNKRVFEYISELSIHNDVFLYKIIDPMEEDFPAQKIILSQHQEQVNIKGSNKKLHRMINSDFNTNLQQFKNAAANYGVHFAQLNTVDAIQDQLRTITL